MTHRDLLDSAKSKNYEMLEIFTANANKMCKWCIVLSRLKEEGHKIGNGVQLAHKNRWKKIYTKLKAPEF